MRLIGADSGLTIDTIRFAETILPKPMLISLIDMIVPPYYRFTFLPARIRTADRGRTLRYIAVLCHTLPYIALQLLYVRAGLLDVLNLFPDFLQL